MTRDFSLCAKSSPAVNSVIQTKIGIGSLVERFRSVMKVNDIAMDSFVSPRISTINHSECNFDRSIFHNTGGFRFIFYCCLTSL